MTLTWPRGQKKTRCRVFLWNLNHVLRVIDDAQVFVLEGTNQVRPRNFGNALCSRSFKQQFPHFIAEEWQDQSYAHIIGTRDIYLGFRGHCYHFYVLDGQVIREPIEDMVTNREEADTLICYHAKCIDDTEGTQNIVVRASDTDIAIILLYHLRSFTATLWMDTGSNTRNSRRYINLSAIGEVLGPLLCQSLPAFHAFKGTDYTSAFVKKGKKRPFLKLEGSKETQRIFANLALEDEVTGTNYNSLKAFTATLYGARQKERDLSLNKYRHKLFQDTYGPKATAKNLLGKLKGLDASALPPCESEIAMHMNRSAFIARMWANAHEKNIDQHPKLQDGWTQEGQEDQYTIVWFQGPQLPDSLIPEEGDMTEDSDDDLARSSDDEENFNSDDEENFNSDDDVH